METTTSEGVLHAGSTKNSTGKFGKLGLDVGWFGRWSRLIWGIVILAPLMVGAFQDIQSSGSSLTFYGLAGLYLLGIGSAYVLVYGLFGERYFAQANPWFNTAVFVGPAFVVAWWEILLLPLTGIGLPTGLPLGMSAYIGISFILQWKIRYGGCEVVSLPILISKRRYTTYCIPLVALDAVEKAVVERMAGPAGPHGRKDDHVKG